MSDIPVIFRTTGERIECTSEKQYTDALNASVVGDRLENGSALYEYTLTGWIEATMPLDPPPPPAGPPEFESLDPYAAKRVEYVKKGYELGFSFVLLDMYDAKSPGKAPSGGGWQLAPRETLEMAVYWAENSNVGIRTGDPSGGILVIDLDKAKAEYDQAQVDALGLPDTVSVITGGGGLHLYYRVPVGTKIKNRVGDLAPAVDIRWTGTQAVYAGARHVKTGRMYEWTPGREPWNFPITELSPELIKKIQTTKVEKPTKSLPAAAATTVAAAVNNMTQTPFTNQPKLELVVGQFPTGLIPKEKNENEYLGFTTLEQMAGVVRKAEVGTRNYWLNRIAYECGRRVTFGIYKIDEVEKALYEAAMETGLEQNEILGAMNPALRSGLEAGKAELPVSMPMPVATEPVTMPTAVSGSFTGTTPPSPAPAVIGQTGNDGAPPPPPELQASMLQNAGVPEAMEDGQKPVQLATSRDHMLMASAFIKACHTDANNFPTIVNNKGYFHFWSEEEGCYQSQKYKDVVGEVWRFLNRCYAPAKDNSTVMVRVLPNDNMVKNVMSALEALLPDLNLEDNAWLDNDDRPTAQELSPTVEGILHLPSLTLMPKTPLFFNVSALPFRVDVNAPTPTKWLWFLDQQWKNDPESIQCVREFGGYVLFGDGKMQKALMMTSRPRAGKGTYREILCTLAGKGNSNPTSLKALTSNFGLMPLIGKKFTYVADCRFYGANSAPVLEKLLTIIGGDPVYVDVKYGPPWQGKLTNRIMICTNELPSLYDSSTALSARFLFVHMPNSFEGNEDTTLADRLKLELPGIFLWFYQGYIELMKRGKFIQPQSGLVRKEGFEEQSNQLKPFAEDALIAAPDGRVAATTLYAAYKQFTIENGIPYTQSMPELKNKLRQLIPGIVDLGQTTTMSGRWRVIQGVKLSETGVQLARTFNNSASRAGKFSEVGLDPMSDLRPRTGSKTPADGEVGEV